MTKDDFTGLTYSYNVIGKVSEIGKTGIAPGTGPILEVAFVDSTRISYLADGIAVPVGDSQPAASKAGGMCGRGALEDIGKSGRVQLALRSEC